MALKPTIYRARVSLNDIDHDKYESISVTLALHPSETLERMMIRLLAYCLNFQEFITFTKGLSTPDEPDIIVNALDDTTTLWVDIGEPSAERIKKATRKADLVKIYTFNEKSDTWYASEQKKMSQLPAEIYQFQWADAEALAAMVERSMDLTMTITGQSVYVASSQGERDVHWTQIQ